MDLRKILRTNVASSLSAEGLGLKILLVSLHLVEYAVELANGLSAKIEVHLVLSAERVERTFGNRLQEKLQKGVKCTLLSKGSLRSFATWKSIWSIFGILLRSKYDVVHLQECANPFNLLFLAFSSRPVVLTIHDVTLHPGRDGSATRPWRLWVRGKLVKHGYSKVIVHGNYLKRIFLENFEKPADDVCVVPHGCLFSFLDGDVVPPPEAAPGTVLFFGRMEKYKGLEYLIRAEPLVSARVPNFKIVIAGAGEDLDLYRDIVSANPHFEIHDYYIPNSDVSRFFRRASAVVLPYVEASQSGIVAMAFAFGTPAVVTDVGSLSEVVIDGITGRVVPPMDDEKMADAITDLLLNEEKRMKMSEEAVKMSHTTLSWGNIAVLTQKVYEEA